VHLAEVTTAPGSTTAPWSTRTARAPGRGHHHRGQLRHRDRLDHNSPCALVL